MTSAADILPSAIRRFRSARFSRTALARSKACIRCGPVVIVAVDIRSLSQVVVRNGWTIWQYTTAATRSPVASDGTSAAVSAFRLVAAAPRVRPETHPTPLSLGDARPTTSDSAEATRRGRLQQRHKSPRVCLER
jgi:hypothetical protein